MSHCIGLLFFWRPNTSKKLCEEPGIFPSMFVLYAQKSWLGEGKALSGCSSFVAILAVLSTFTGIKVAKGAGGVSNVLDVMDSKFL